jgi:heme-degrading monooxygenase HmoA
MFARVSTLQGSPDQVKALGDRQVPPEVSGAAGFKGAYALANRESGKVLLITLWETEQAMQASAEAVKQSRGRIAKDVGASAAPVVEMYEVITQP